MSLTKALITDDEFSAKYYSNGRHKIMFPDQNCELVSPNLEPFLNSPQPQYVEDLHIVMKLFWVRELDPLGYLENASKERTHPYILQRVLNKLKEAKAGKDGPLLRSLTLEGLFEWRPNGRKDITQEDYCLAQYGTMARVAGVKTLQWKWPEGSGHMSCN